MTRVAVVFAGGVAAGLMSSIAIVLGVIGAAVAVAFMLLMAVVGPRFAALSGGLIALGVAWLALFASAAAMCARPDQPCGTTPPDVTPWLALATALILIGAFAGLATLVRARRTTS